MSLRLQVALGALVVLLAGGAAAQDDSSRALVDDEWEAILKLTPPATSATSDEAPVAKEREERASARAAREGNGPKERSAGSSSADRDAEKPGAERSRRDGSSGAEKSLAGSDKSSTAEASKRAARLDSASKEGASRTQKSAKIELATEFVITATRGSKSEERDKRGDTSARSSEPPSSLEAFRGSGIASYDELVRSWHEPWPVHAADQAIDLLAGAPPVLSLHPVGKQSTPYVLLPNGRDGGFNEAQLAVASQAFGSWPGGPQICPRLLDLIYHAAQHFKVFHVHLISGVRDDRSGSRHSHGLAADIVLPGVSNEELAAYFRAQGFLGVGIYTRAGFVHVDVREKSFFWLDKSPPGRRTKVIPIRAEEARLADEAAIARGQVGYVNPPRLQKALIARAKRRREKALASQ